MAITIDSVQILQDYLRGVLDRAGHHAQNVEGVALAIMGAVIWRAEGAIEVKQYAGSPANLLWFWVNGNRYALTYNHAAQTIEMKDRTHAGNVLHSFTNGSSYQDVISAFMAL